ncbi:complex I subunit 4 family protein [Angustibacter sp. McL0619]|uniref:complex I subunit 4 family protein n=1 Tax=Angustibacter sp. McL0619 TaxID=3415676 RepID=UPI003CEB715C
MSDLLLLAVGLPLLVSLGLLLAPRALGEQVAAVTGVVTSAVVLLCAVLMLAARPWQSPGPALEIDWPWIPTLGVRLHLVVDGISWPLIVLTAALGVAVTVHAARQSPVASPEAVASGDSAPTGTLRSLVVALLAVEGGALATFTAADVVLFFVAFEIVLVPMWAIIRWWGDPHDDAGRRDAASRFVLYTALGSAVMLLGILVLALDTGTSDLVELAAAHGTGMSHTTQLVVAGLLVGGLSVKVPVWPLHTWLPSAHTAAPTVGSVLLAGVLLKMGSYGMVRIVVPTVPQGFAQVAPFLGALGVVGILWGGLVCLVERDLKRLIAYSSVAHMGFVALGIASGTPQGLQGALFANVAHGVITALLFLVVGGLKDRTGSGRLDRVGRGLRDGSPHLGALLAFGCVAGLGLPGLAGFWGELLAVYGAWQGPPQGDLAFWRTLAVLAVVGTVLAAAYLLRVLRVVWHGVPEAGPEAATSDEPVAAASVRSDATRVEVLVGTSMVAVTVLLGLVPWLLLRMTEPGVLGLLAIARGGV